ncbi:hypothetical protein [Aeromonas caviae]|uniref:hypothetical protein n=1 Tax=Aeromonas caviae TaxID=648 RepID=UPI001F32EA65|nr:hypothetical protein [Aeromonas caviae]
MSVRFISWSIARLPWLAVFLLGAFPQLGIAGDCTYRKDSLGYTRYQCQDGRHGSLRTDSLGTVRDSGTGVTWRKVSLGNLRASDGTLCRSDSLGTLHCDGGSPPPVVLQPE